MSLGCKCKTLFCRCEPTLTHNMWTEAKKMQEKDSYKKVADSLKNTHISGQSFRRKTVTSKKEHMTEERLKEIEFAFADSRCWDAGCVSRNCLQELIAEVRSLQNEVRRLRALFVASEDGHESLRALLKEAPKYFGHQINCIAHDDEYSGEPEEHCPCTCGEQDLRERIDAALDTSPERVDKE